MTRSKIREGSEVVLKTKTNEVLIVENVGENGGFVQLTYKSCGNHVPNIKGGGDHFHMSEIRLNRVLAEVTKKEALILLNCVDEKYFATIEINDGAVCVGGSASLSIDHLNKHSSILPTDKIMIWFDGINALIERKNQIEANHLTRIVRDLNLLCDCYIEELGLEVELILDKPHTGHYEINVYYKNINDNAEPCAVHVAEMAHIYVGQHERLVAKTNIDVAEINV